jgi:hypothetical protein
MRIGGRDTSMSRGRKYMSEGGETERVHDLSPKNHHSQVGRGEAGGGRGGEVWRQKPILLNFLRQWLGWVMGSTG